MSKLRPATAPQRCASTSAAAGARRNAGSWTGAGREGRPCMIADAQRDGESCKLMRTIFTVLAPSCSKSANLLGNKEGPLCRRRGSLLKQANDI